MTTNEIARQIVDEHLLSEESGPSLMSAITAALDAERERAERYKKALQFYAQKTDLYGERAHQMNTDRENYRILEDKGYIAREALKETEI